MKNNSLLLAVLSAGLLSACSTLDSINPFDKSEADKRAEQGAVAGEDQRISILELSETLSVVAPTSPDSILLPDPYVNTDWPQAGGNVQHVVQHTGATGPLDKSWSVNIGEGSGRKGRIVAPPVIANGAIFTVDSRYEVRAFDESSGDEMWSFKVEAVQRESTREGKTSFLDRIKDPLTFADGDGSDKEGVGGGVAFANDKVFVASGLGKMVALNAQTGELIWARQTRVPLNSIPTVDNGRVFVISDDNELFALNENTGEVLWSYQGIIETASMLTAPAPAVIDDVVLAPFSSGELIALRVQNGGVLWQDSLSSTARLTPLASLNDISGGPAVADGYVIATAQSGVMTAFDLRTGQRVWSVPAGSLSIPLIAGDVVFTATTTGQVAALSKLDGTILWIAQLESYKNEKKRKERTVWTGPLLAGNRLVVASSAGNVTLLDPRSGAVIKEMKVKSGVFVPPVIANETVYILTDEAKLVAFK
ncbi:MAG: PQQ-binding-like beta-propeller repeat protein [Litorimonas sp.]